MGTRIVHDVRRAAPIEITVDGTPTLAYEGESLATALLAAGHAGFSRDAAGRLRSPFCNMGVCFDCLVSIESAGTRRRVRACLTAATAGLRVNTATDGGATR